MHVAITRNKRENGRTAAAFAEVCLQEALNVRGQANLILATGASQFEMLEHLVGACVDWSKVTVFHLDEYLGLGADHPASFRKYLRERFHQRVAGLREFVYVNGDAPDGAAECRRLGQIIGRHPIDVACIGIGENGHLAFNDPPADFQTDEPYLVVNLDEACRRQQLGEGWFHSLDDVPRQAISMSVRQMLKSRCLIVTVSDQRKAPAVRDAIEGSLGPIAPASALRVHARCHLFLDEPAASMLRAQTRVLIETTAG